MSSPIPFPGGAEPANLLTEWSRLLLGSFARLGVRDVIVSPGSRSTPFVWAALQTPELTCHSVLDERAAGFFALGLGRATGRPALLLCTSGTAAAHYFPAVIEAAESHVPLLILTADRPGELRQAAAPQTIDQTRLFGEFARGFFELGTPSPHESAFRSVSRFASQAYERSLGALPGPVQLNAPARKPLEPQTARTEEERSLTSWVDRQLASTTRIFAPLPGASSGVDDFVRRLSESKRPLLIAGPLRPEDGREVAAWASQLAVPLLAESASHAPESAPLDLALRSLATLEKPDLVVLFGTPCTSSRLPAALDLWDAHQISFAPAGHPDPTQRSDAMLLGDIAATLRSCRERLDERTASLDFDRLYLAAWRRRSDDVRRAATQLLTDAPAPETTTVGLSEPHAVLAALQSVPEESQILLGNSLPLRVADWVASSWRSNRPRVFVQRGVNGIDGLIATSAGLATATRRPTLAVLGDVTTAHDLSSLAIARRSTTPICLLVVDNAGGHIFDQLPLARRRSAGEEPELPGLADVWEFWSTPPDVDFVKIAEGYGARGVEARSLESLRSEVTQALATPGLTLVRVRTEASSTAHFLREFDALVTSLPAEPR